MSKCPAIFYSPHQDDEAIGMAGAIQEHKDEGRPVYLVLLSNGINIDLLNILNGSTFCTWHQTYHNFRLTMEQMIWARKAEFAASAKQLGVDKIFIVNDGRGLDDRESYIDYDMFVGRVADTIKRFEAMFPGASHRLISGSLDLLPEEFGTTHPTHKACWDAAMLLRNKIPDFKFYRVNIFYKPKKDRVSQFHLKLKPEWQNIKQAALNQYKLFVPDTCRFATGYHSVPNLIDEAYDDDKEYLDFLP